MSHASEDQGGSSVLSESGESSRGGANREAVHPARPAAGLSRRDLIPGAPLEFHRHVLSHVLYDGAGEETLAARHVPTEIVRASGAIAIGIPATILAEDFAAPSHDNADGGSDTQAVPGTRRRREELCTYTEAHEQPTAPPKIVHLAQLCSCDPEQCRKL
eukprot:GHVT01032747.1.p1 GENE.GHVT01032747.1~~GHVT01032747.1.p1  ORF type:complete len:160 (-),score=22.28 GHVT01032747.1:2470-2949(-)